MASSARTSPSFFRKPGVKRVLSSWQLYVLLLPTFVYVAIFCYRPMYGVLIAFEDFTIGGSIWDAPWVGLKHFRRLFNMPQFGNMIRNTLSISVYSLLVGFPIPILLALIMNSITSVRYKRLIQTVTYAPHFISTVVVIGMLNVFLAPSTGVVNSVIQLLGGPPKFFMGDPELFADMYVWSGVWQNMGYSSIIYLAALTGVNPELHEVAMVEGASKIRRIWHIDLPCILPTIVTLLIMQCGRLMSVGFDKAYLMQNALNLSASEVLSTYVYKIGMLNSQFSFSTAVDLFNCLINIILLVIVNAICNKLGDISLW